MYSTTSPPREYLISEHYPRSARLGIHGRSNGGLLIARS